MAFFKFRKAADETATAPPAAHSIEALRQRAKYRLVGASVLVLLGVVGFPLLFDKQPRPIAVDTPIDIPDRNKVPPLTLPAAPVPTPEVPAPAATAVAPAATALPVVLDKADAGVITETAQPPKLMKNLDEKRAAVPSNKASVAVKTDATELPKSSKPEAHNTAAQLAESAKAQAVLDGKPVDNAAAAPGRFVVQVGAFADPGRAHEVRLKLERAGMKTYTHVADTKDGKRIRVRVGPFSLKPEAEKAAAKIRKLDLPAALLTL